MYRFRLHITRLGVFAALAASCAVLTTASSAAPLAIAGSRATSVTAPTARPAPASAPASTPAPAPKVTRRPTRGARAHVLAVDDYVLTVTNLDRSVAFYRDVIGLPLWRTAGTATANALEQSLTDTPGARFRSAAFRNPSAGPALVLTEFTGIARRALRPRTVDPGAATLQLQVSDLSRVLAAAARARTPIVTLGSRPLITDRDGARNIVLRDPDGFYVLLSQLPLTRRSASGTGSAAAPASGARSSAAGNVLGWHLLCTVAAPATLVRFYRSVLGLRVQAGAFTVDHTFDELVDAPGAQLAVMEAAAENAATADAVADALRFVAFRGVARHTYSGRPQDPGTPGFVLRVADLTAALRAIRASGTIVISAGGQPVGSGQSAAVLIRDPDGVLVQLVQQPAPLPSSHPSARLR